MRTFPLQNANSSVVAVTTTATALSSLIDTAGAVTHVFTPGMDAIDIAVEDGDIRILFDGNTPTASKGLLLKRGVTYRLRRTPFAQVKAISATGASVSCSLQIGNSEPGETSTSSSSPLLLEQIAGENINRNLLRTEAQYTNVRVTADGLGATGAGFIHTVDFAATGAVTAGVITIYDNTAESGTVLWSGTIQTGINPISILLDVAFSIGLYIGYDGTIANVATRVSIAQ